ncbi:hypothetical protein GCM10022212_37650 [Actimicrobium antarcticum]|uniref:Uncharacterized protein n=2 Tax=Actimicrobium antarcticum TaxID=1051899 RepID=A0ABP7U230_9BURK
MATVIVHHTIRIITLAIGDAIADHARDGDIALNESDTGWWVNFIGENGAIDGYDDPFDSYGKALATAKAAAEYAAE